MANFIKLTPLSQQYTKGSPDDRLLLVGSSADTEGDQADALEALEALGLGGGTIADGSVTESKCNSSINASLDLADSSIQPGNAALTDARTPLSHTHGNLTNDGKIGSTSGLPLKTGTAGVVEAGDDESAVALITYAEPPSGYSAEQLEMFTAIRAGLIISIQNL
jgi:hypothetical protein